jgi:hypothetical protein
MSLLPAVKLWLWLSVLASLAGWGLSLVGQLNRLGYVIVGVVALIVLNEARARRAVEFGKGPWRWRKIRRRFRRGLPLAFAVLAALVFVSGVLYAPSNHTGLSYRIPRVLHWLQAGEWHWIFTPNLRMNTRACGIEWLSAPLLLFTGSDRLLFLLNFIPFVLLPGLLFSVLTRLGVRGRVAWPWMWLLPTGYVFLLQAGSGGNDAYPVAYALAAVDFALRAWRSWRASDLWHSLLAIALLGGAKASNLPLMLPWFVLVAPLWRVGKEKPAATARVVALALIVSFLPTAWLNHHYIGDWSALQYERPGMGMKNPLVGVYGNALLLLQNNLCPPFFPIAKWWNQHELQLLPGFLVRPMVKHFEEGFHFLWELPTEDWCGLGLGVTVLLLISALWAAKSRLTGDGWRVTGSAALFPSLATRHAARFHWLVLLSPWLALLAYCAKSGMVTPARLIAPYYPLLLPLLLVGAEQSRLVRARWWRGLAWAVVVVAFGVLIVTPARPLWPAQTILRQAVAAAPANRLLQRALDTYAVYAIRADPLPDLRAKLPPGLKVVGFLGTHDDLDISFWRPFGSRRVEQISHVATAEQIRARKLEYAIVSGMHLELAKLPLADWLTQMRAEVVAETSVAVTVSVGPRPWYLVRFKD